MGPGVLVSSSDDSSLALPVVGLIEGEGGGRGLVGEGMSNRRFLRGDQPGGRRLVNS